MKLFTASFVCLLVPHPKPDDLNILPNHQILLPLLLSLSISSPPAGSGSFVIAGTFLRLFLFLMSLNPISAGNLMDGILNMNKYHLHLVTDLINDTLPLE